MKKKKKTNKKKNITKAEIIKIIFAIFIISSILFFSNYRAYSITQISNIKNIESKKVESSYNLAEVLLNILDRFSSLRAFVNIGTTDNFTTTNDKDGDGLLDNEAQYVNNQMVAPKDPDPETTNGPIGLWQKQLQVEQAGNIPYYLTDYYTYYNEELINKSILDWVSLSKNQNIFEATLNSNILLEVSSSILNFRLDNGGTVLHSQTKEEIYDYMMQEAEKNLTTIQYTAFKLAVEALNIKDKTETWQKKYGYNDLYDNVFRIATNNNMRSEQFYFQDNNEEYVLWVWRGDYLTLGSGAEMGLYKKNKNVHNAEHWDAIDFTVPMTLNLYNYYDANNIEHIFSWKPQNNQWWITGFNPNYQDIDVTKQMIIGTIDLSQYPNMYYSIKQNINESNKKYIICDDTTYKIWIIFYD